MTILIIVMVFAGVAGLVYFGVLPGRRPVDDTAPMLRTLLKERADGTIGEEEFLGRQEALHSKLVADAGRAPIGAGGAMRWAAALAIFVVAGGLYVWLGNTNDAALASVAPSGVPAPAPAAATAAAPARRQRAAGT